MSKLIEIVGPDLHHPDPLVPELGGMHARRTSFSSLCASCRSMASGFQRPISRKPDTLNSSFE
jgi:hypothetical protein